MNPAIIVTMHDTTWLYRVVENVRRQSLQLPVVLVVNGKARGFRSHWLTIESEDSHAAAVNAGAEAWRERGGTHAICFDSDDYYGHGYARQAVSALSGGDFVGKRAIYTWLSDGGLHLFNRPHFMGGTIGFALDRFVPMRAILQDDFDWCERMRASGAVGVDTGPSEYCYVRHGSNAHWRADDVIARRALGDGTHFPGAVLHDVSANLIGGVRRAMPTDTEVLASLASL